VPGVPRQSVAMRLVGVIQARVFGFLRREMSVECLRFKTDLWHELTLEEPLKVDRISRFGPGEHALVDELVDGASLHLEGRDAEK